MRGTNYILGCVAAGLAMAPFCACRGHLVALFCGNSFDEWFVLFFTSGDGIRAFRSAAIVCAVFGLIVGILMRQAFGAVDPRKEFEITLLRTPIAATVLAPVGITTILLFLYNHTPQAFAKIIWPDFYFNYLAVWSVVFGLLGAFLAGFLNDLERSYEKSPLGVRVGILCCWPLAVGFGLVLIAGIVGGGLLIGAAIGRQHGCPIAGGWTGMCLGAVVLALIGDVFWPMYFPMTRIGKD